MSAALPWAHIAGQPEDDIASYVLMAVPLHYAGGTLFTRTECEPFIHVEDSSGTQFTTRSAEWLLRNIDHFAAGRDQDQALAHAALHFGFEGIYALMGRGRCVAEDLQQGEPA